MSSGGVVGEVRAIVAAHGDLADGLVDAVAVISGRGDALRAVSNRGLDARGLVAELKRAIVEAGTNVVFTDLPGGSCTLAVRRLQRDLPSLVLVTGVNLPMLLEYVLHDDEGADALASAVARGREHVRRFGGADVD